MRDGYVCHDTVSSNEIGRLAVYLDQLDLFAPLEDIQPEILGRFPSFRRFVILQQHSLDIGFPCCGRFGGVDLDSVGLGG